jgi:hypothetical protein
MGFSLGSLVGGGLGFLVGGPAGAALGAGLGTAAGGGSLKEDIAAAGLGYLGGVYGPGLAGGEAAAGGLGLTAPATANLAEMGGAQGLTLGGGLGTGLADYSLGTGGLGAVDYSLGSAGAGGVGLTGDALGGYTGSGVGGSYMDQLRRQFAGLGFGAGGAGGNNLMNYMKLGLGGLQLAGGLQQYGYTQDRMAQQQQYARQIQALQANPSSVEALPGYQAGLRAVQRRARAEGFGGSGTMAAQLAGYGGQQYQQQLANLAQLQGGTIAPGAPMMALTGAGLGAYGLGSGAMGLGLI